MRAAEEGRQIEDVATSRLPTLWGMAPYPRVRGQLDSRGNSNNKEDIKSVGQWVKRSWGDLGRGG